jgi:hypothetical protein
MRRIARRGAARLQLQPPQLAGRAPHAWRAAAASRAAASSRALPASLVLGCLGRGLNLLPHAWGCGGCEAGLSPTGPCQRVVAAPAATRCRRPAPRPPFLVKPGCSDGSRSWGFGAARAERDGRWAPAVRARERGGAPPPPAPPAPAHRPLAPAVGDLQRHDDGRVEARADDGDDDGHLEGGRGAAAGMRGAAGAARAAPRRPGAPRST